MASLASFELDDQTDEDFFDKLVDDDDDDVVGVVPSLKVSTGLVKVDDLLVNDDSDEVKSVANSSLNEVGNVSSNQAELSVSEVDNGSSGPAVLAVSGVDNGSGAFVGLSVSEVDNGSGAFGELSISEFDNGSSGPAVLTISEFGNGSGAFAESRIREVDNGSGDFESNEVKVDDDNRVSLQSVEARGEGVIDGDVSSSLVSSDLFSFGNGKVEDGVVGSEVISGLRRESSGLASVGVKEVDWSAFSDVAENGSGGFGSYDDFFTNLGQGDMGNLQSGESNVVGNQVVTNTVTASSYDHGEQIANGVDTNSVEYYESQYPGWKYDANTGQWYQLDTTGGTANGQENFEAAGGNVQGNVDTSVGGNWAVSDVNSSQVSYQQQYTPSSVGTITESKTATENVFGWKPNSQQNGEFQYPSHMLFDPQYSGWYYDTMLEKWCSLDEYHSVSQSTELQCQDGSLGSMYTDGNTQGINSFGLQVPGSEGSDVNQNWTTSAATTGHYVEQGSSDGKAASGMQSGSAASYNTDRSWPSSHDENVYNKSQMIPQNTYELRGNVPSYGQQSQQQLQNLNWASGVSNFVASDNALQQFNHPSQVRQNGLVQPPTNFYNNQNTATVSHPLFSNGHHAPHAPSAERSSAGRPPHALVTFGFGGKLVVMKDTSAVGFSMYGNKDAEGQSVSVLNLMEIVGSNNYPSSAGESSSYFHSLCHQSFPGPLVGGSGGSKEINKWVDERIANYESLGNSDGKGEAPKLLLSLLKVAYQHYGKLRSFGVDAGLKENDLPESALANLFASAKRLNGQFSQYGAIAKCLTTLPSEEHIQVTAFEVQNLLISGRKKEALQRAQEGRFWGFALILARELGDQLYADTVKQMAISQLVTGSPLRTLCLLIAKKPGEVFSDSVMPAGNLPGVSPQSVQYVNQSTGYSMVDNWEENLAVMTANRTENDHLVLTHLGDCLWKDKNNVTAAHICYLVSEADLEVYSDTARLCLIGADHWKFPRTFASPEAIQRTELYEYAKVLGNSQFVLLSLQPYKLIYAHMLAEVGRVSDSLKYCQSVHKSLKNARSPEADLLRQLLSSLEERCRTHQQSGYAANLAPAKIVGKFFNFIDSTAQRVVGGLPPPAPTVPNSFQGNDHQFQTPGSKATNSVSNMPMSSIMPSLSMEAISQWAVDGSKITPQNRSSSESDIGRSPGMVDTSNQATSSSTDDKKSSSTATSRFGLSFGSQIFQKVGSVLKPRLGRQAKLGDSNKFYYDEKLKRWVEEGAEAPAEEAALPPPPTTAVFQNQRSDSISDNGPSASGYSPEPSSSTPSFGIPAIPPSSNQFSARGRMGVRSRYVDTFNKGGAAPTNMFQAPPIQSSKPANLPSAKFFIPTAVSPSEQTSGGESESANDVHGSREQSPSSGNDPFQNLAPAPAATMQRFPSVDNIPNKGATGTGFNSVAPQSRRTASWSAIHGNTFTPPSKSEVKASPLSFMPSNQSSGSLHNSGGSFGDDLQEVEL